MPTCVHCNRPFLNKEALHQHLASSGNQHPFCAKCDRRFISQVALESHIAAKHPPSFDCELCRRSFITSFALDDHYRGSVAHPNCARCGKGFKDVTERDEHRKTSHRLAACGLCEGIFIDEDTMEDHYKESDNHPSCFRCGWGFKDKHITLFHPELKCGACGENFKTSVDLQAHYANSSKHKKCDECGRGCKDNTEYLQHVKENHTKSVPIPTTKTSWDHGQISTTPHHDLPPLRQVIDQAWVSTKSTLPQSSFISSYVPWRATHSFASGQTLYSTSDTPTSPWHTLKQWPTDRGFNNPLQVSRQPSKEIRAGSSQQSISPASQRDSWKSDLKTENNDQLGPCPEYTGPALSNTSFNPFGIL